MVKNVINYLLVFILFSYSLDSLSQRKIEGKYSGIDGTGKVFERLLLSKDHTFKYESGGDLGISKYGKGHYFIKNDSLILNYDLTELKVNSYHTSKHYDNYKDSVEIKITVISMNKKPLHNILVNESVKKTSIRTNINGSTLFKFKKERKKNTIFIKDDKFGFYYFTVWNHLNHDVEVFFRKNPLGAIAISGITIKYKIIEHTETSIKLKYGDKLMKLKKY
ncbi:MAG: hypothetical protein JXR05_14740 [Flavobacteriaceae bacterium]